MSDITYPKVSQGYAHVASSFDIANDDAGFTNPNLHRRVDPQVPNDGSEEVSPREYEIGVFSTDSYRTTTIHYHEEKSTTSEIP